MAAKKSASIMEHFSELTDPRTGRVTYPFINIIVIGLCAVIAGADDFVAMAEYGRIKRKWLSMFLDLTNGIPSHDRFNAVFAAIKPAEFEKCFLSWITALHEITQGQIVAIDGKTLRRSFDHAAGKAALHMVTAWSTANQISLGQVAADAKSNEIAAIPQLLQILEIKGCLVTIDAAGCQTKIANQIVQSGGDYVLAVKKNQPKLYQGIADRFCHQFQEDSKQSTVISRSTKEKSHGRETVREYHLYKVPKDLPDRDRWRNLRAIGMVVTHTIRNGKESIVARYYILSKFVDVKHFADAVRGHWKVENQLHWQLDVTFGEDRCRIRKRHADRNFSILRKTALSLLKNHKGVKVGVKNKRLVAALDDDYLQQVLLGK